MNKKYCLFIGRWQPFHQGHKVLVETVLKEGKNVWIGIRNTTRDENNPYSIRERGIAIRKALSHWPAEQIKITEIPDIEEVCYGRDVGYKIREIRLPKKLEKISATKIRHDNIHNRTK